eukprot:scaffold54571_cov40-Phaeocystis_antarctica.AAC.1
MKSGVRPRLLSSLTLCWVLFKARLELWGSSPVRHTAWSSALRGWAQQWAPCSRAPGRSSAQGVEVEASVVARRSASIGAITREPPGGPQRAAALA